MTESSGKDSPVGLFPNFVIVMAGIIGIEPYRDVFIGRFTIEDGLNRFQVIVML